MDRPYKLPANEVEVEVKILNSRFIASLAPALSVDQAKIYIKGIKSRYPDATHHVSAFIIGFPPGVITHSNDDGEPPGTAGRPLLTVLTGSGLGDIVAVVTRYFGGTKLGTGGLVKAYTLAAQEGLHVLPLAQKIPMTTIQMTMDYPWYDRINILIAAFDGEILQKNFAEQINIDVRFSDDKWGYFDPALQKLTNASVKPVLITQNVDMIVPIK